MNPHGLIKVAQLEASIAAGVNQFAQQVMDTSSRGALIESMEKVLSPQLILSSPVLADIFREAEGAGLPAVDTARSAFELTKAMLKKGYELTPAHVDSIMDQVEKSVGSGGDLEKALASVASIVAYGGLVKEGKLPAAVTKSLRLVFDKSGLGLITKLVRMILSGVVKLLPWAGAVGAGSGLLGLLQGKGPGDAAKDALTGRSIKEVFTGPALPEPRPHSMVPTRTYGKRFTNDPANRWYQPARGDLSRVLSGWATGVYPELGRTLSNGKDGVTLMKAVPAFRETVRVLGSGDVSDGMGLLMPMNVHSIVDVVNRFAGQAYAARQIAEDRLAEIAPTKEETNEK